jgi:pimeloyl-ACP methyl ester carboxylesterase
LINVLPPFLEPRVVAFPGDQPLGYEALVPRVVACLPTTSPFLLLGESFSGPLALMVASLGPPGLGGVILSATFVRNPLRFHPEWAHRLVGDWMFSRFKELSLAKAWLGSGESRQRQELVKLALAGVQPRVLAHRLREVLRVDVRAELQNCPVPVLYLQAERDWAVHGHNGAEIKACHPGVQITRIPSSHFLLQTQPELALQAIQDFFGLDRSRDPEPEYSSDGSGSSPAK